MIASYKKELYSLFATTYGTAFLSSFLLLSGLTTSITNLFNQDSHYETTTLQILPWYLLFLLPLLTMRSITGERQNGTLILLYTNANELWETILGKFLACFSTLGIALLLTLIYPLIYEIYHYVNWSNILSAYFGLSLLSAMYLSIGIWISSLSEDQASAAILSLLSFLSLFLSGTLLPLLPQGTKSSIISILLASSIALWHIRRLTPPILLASLTAVLLSLAGAAWLYQAKFLIGLLARTGNFLSPLEHYINFTQGLIRIADCLYFLTNTGLFLCLSILQMGKKRWV